DDNRDHYAAFIPFYVEGDPAERVDRYRLQFDAGEGFVYAAFEGDRMIGGGMLFPRIGPDALELGYQLRRDATGRGFATELAGALLRVAFDVCGVARVEAHIDPLNGPSIAVARRLGLEEAGYDEGDVIFSAVRSPSDASVRSASASDASSGG
ncbi:MAG: GNAT family N-acetyltransferase, partial [Actinomycetota bacterium]